MLHTISDIARRSGYPPHRIRHLIKTRGIATTLRLGDLGAYIFDDETVATILAELDLIAVRRLGPALCNKARMFECG